MIKPKRAMTSLDVASVVKELEKLRGARIANLYAVQGGFLFRLKSPGADARLIAIPGERVHLTSYDVSEKGFPPPLVMALRKHLRGGRIVDVAQHGFDRILVLRIASGSEEYKVFIEVLPRGVLVLTDADGNILQASEYREMRDRVVKRGRSYTPPPSRSIPPWRLSVEHVGQLLRGNEGEAVRILVRGLGYPGEAVEEALLRVGLKPETSAREAVSEANRITEALKELYAEALEAKGWILYSGGHAVSVVTFNPKMLAKHYGFSVRSFESASEAFDQYFVAEMRSIEEARASAQLEAERRKLLASLERARRNLEELKEKLAIIDKHLAVVGENIGTVYEAIMCARRIRERAGWEHIAGNCPAVVDVDPSSGILYLSLGGEVVPLSIREEPDRVLVALSRRRGEIEAKIKRGEEALRELEARLAELEKRAAEAAAQGRARVRKKEWYERYHWLITSHGFLAIGGRDASQNESVVKRYLTPRRIFMHADIHGAPAVVVFAEGETPPAQDLREAATLTAVYSKAWKAGVGAVDVYWVWGGQVSKSAPAGEYLARGAFMVYGKRNYIRNVELKLALGVGIEDEAPLVIAGPEELVRKRSVVYAVLVPGDEDPSRLAQRIRRVFRNKVEEKYRAVLDALKAEEIRLRIPGKARVIRFGRGESKEPPRPLRELHRVEEGETSTS